MAYVSVLLDFSLKMSWRGCPPPTKVHKTSSSHQKKPAVIRRPSTSAQTDSSADRLSPPTQLLQRQIREKMRRWWKQPAYVTPQQSSETEIDTTGWSELQRERDMDKKSLAVLERVTKERQAAKSKSTSTPSAPARESISPFEGLEWSPASESSRFSPTYLSGVNRDPFVGQGSGNEFERSLSRLQDLRRGSRIVQGASYVDRGHTPERSATEDMLKWFAQLEKDATGDGGNGTHGGDQALT